MTKRGSAGGIAAIVMRVIAFSFAYQQGYFNAFKERIYVVLGNGKWPQIEPDVNITPPPVEGNISYIEHEAFRGVNNEREKAGLAPLEWNSDLVYVARLHSQDMAERGYFSHHSPENKSHDDRLHEAGIYYYNRSAENLAKIKHVSSYTYNTRTGKIINKTYRTLEEVAEAAVEGWMNSTSHRENIMIPGLDESGIGLAYDAVNESFYFTQLFITRIHCGYRGASCCLQNDHLLCYMPWNCTEGICG